MIYNNLSLIKDTNDFFETIDLISKYFLLESIFW